MKPQAVECRVRTKTGETRWVRVTSSPHLLLDGSILWTGVILDITERKRAEEELKESEEKFRCVTEQSPNMIFINKKGRVVYANKKCEEIMGYETHEFYSPDFDLLTLIAPEFRELVRGNLSRHMSGEEVPPYRCALVTKDGKRIEALLTTKLIQYGGEAAIIGTVTEITERQHI